MSLVRENVRILTIGDEEISMQELVKFENGEIILNVSVGVDNDPRAGKDRISNVDVICYNLDIVSNLNKV